MAKILVGPSFLWAGYEILHFLYFSQVVLFSNDFDSYLNFNLISKVIFAA